MRGFYAGPQFRHERPQAGRFRQFTQIGVECLDAFNYFGKQNETQDIPALLLISEDQQDFLDQADFSEHRSYVETPIKLRDLRKKLIKTIRKKYQPQDKEI